MRKLIFVLLTAAALASCQGAVRQADRGGSDAYVPEDLTERFVHQTVNDLKDRFQDKDVPGFMRTVSEGFYKGSARLRENLERTLARMPAPVVTQRIEGVEVEDLKITVVVDWATIFTPAGEEKPLELTGRTVLVYLRTETISLVDFRGDAPYGIEGF